MRDDLDATAVVILITGALGGIAYQWLLDPGGLDLDRVVRGPREDTEPRLALSAGPGDAVAKVPRDIPEGCRSG